MRHDNEGNLSVRLIDHGEDFTPQFENDRVVCEGEKLKIDLYQIEPNAEHPDGASEFEITLKEKPLSNVIKFSIRTKGFAFHYQPQLTLAEIEDGALRPENFVGSYAVYYAEEKLNLVEGQHVYRSGKAAHWYRPKIEDSKGEWIWGELHIDVDNELVTVTIPQDFLDRAVYPVRHAAGATFGYTTVGGTSYDLVGNRAQAAYATPSLDGSVSKISMYMNGGGFQSFKGVIWLGSDGTVLSGGITPAVALGTGLTWYDATFSVQPNILAVPYLVGGVIDNTISTRYDSVTNGGDADSVNNYSLPTTLVGQFSNGRAYSAYATYSPASFLPSRPQYQPILAQ